MQTRRTLAALLAMTVAFSALPALAAQVDRRERRQQDRIAKGTENGSLAPRETGHLERREGHIDREVARDRAAHGGHLTQAEHHKVERQENRTSRAIHRDRHNARHL